MMLCKCSNICNVLRTWFILFMKTVLATECAKKLRLPKFMLVNEKVTKPSQSNDGFEWWLYWFPKANTGWLDRSFSIAWRRNMTNLDWLWHTYRSFSFNSNTRTLLLNFLLCCKHIGGKEKRNDVMFCSLFPFLLHSRFIVFFPFTIFSCFSVRSSVTTSWLDNKQTNKRIIIIVASGMGVAVQCRVNKNWTVRPVNV